MLYRNKDTDETKTEGQLYTEYILLVAEGIIEENGFDDYLEGITDTNGLYELTQELTNSYPKHAQQITKS